MWVDVGAICGHRLSGLALVPTGTTGGTSSTATEKGTLSVLGAPSSSWGEASSSLEAYTPVFLAMPSSFSSTITLQSSCQILSLRSMPMVATSSHHNDSTVPPFAVSKPHEAGHYFVEPMALGCTNGLP